MANITQVGIVNLALRHIKQRTIESMTENTIQAKATLDIYSSALEEVLRSHHWPFAKTIKALVLISDYEPLSWDYGYTYPSNCVIIRKVYNEATADKNIGEKFEEVFDPTDHRKVIETDCKDAYGEYTYNLTDTTLYDPTFITTLSHRLAAGLAVPLNGDQIMAEKQLQIFNTIVSEAKRISAEEMNKPHEQTSSYETARE